jgi:hypothetical protein
VFFLKLTIHARMVASEGAASNHCHSKFLRFPCHSKNRNLKMCHTAATPSRQVIFLPSS